MRYRSKKKHTRSGCCKERHKMEDVYKRRLEAFAHYANDTHLAGISFDPARHVFRTNPHGDIHTSATLCAYMSGWYDNDNPSAIPYHNACVFPYVKLGSRHTEPPHISVHSLEVDPTNGDAFFVELASVPIQVTAMDTVPEHTHNVKRYAMPPPPSTYQETIRERLSDHLQRKRSVLILRQTKQSISLSPTLCAALRGEYEDPERSRLMDPAYDKRTFPIFITGKGIGAAYLNMDATGPSLTPLWDTFVNV